MRIARVFLAALTVAMMATIAQAQVIVRTPGVNVYVPGKAGVVMPPRVLPSPSPVYPAEVGAPPLVPGEVPGVVIPPVVGPSLRVQSVAEFVAGFRPGPSGGRYEVMLIHPCTHCPVKVCFDLPCGCPRRIRQTRTGFEIRYSLCKVVVVRFLSDGTVRVRG